MTFRNCIYFIVFLIGLSKAWAQEKKHLDQKPQDVYGPRTTLFTTQENIQYNKQGYQPVTDDFDIGSIHRFTFVQRYGNKLQNLGNNGTAVKPIFYILPKDVGATSGFHAYDIYFRSPDQFRYYDTKSPYSRMYVMLARFGSLFADVCYSRNVTPQWNIGVNFRHMMTDKEWIPMEVPGDRNVIANGLDLFTHCKTGQEQYQLLAHLLIMKHRVRETGGVIPVIIIPQGQSSPNFSPIKEKKLLEEDLISNRLERKAESSNTRKRFHLYHQLALAKEFWVYHELDLKKDEHRFEAELTDWNKFFLGGKIVDPQETIDNTTAVWSTQNEAGLKGNWQELFYSSYYRHKGIELRCQTQDDDSNLDEHYLGLTTRYKLTERADLLYLGGEYLLGGLYKARVGYESNLLDLACERVKYKPSLLTQHYHGYQRNWENKFTPSTATRISGGVRLAGEGVLFRPALSFTSVENHIYFQHPSQINYEKRFFMIAVPQQAQKHAHIIALDNTLNFAMGAYLHWDNELTFTKVLGPKAKVFSVPSFMINSKLYYAQKATSGNAAMETGIDLHWKSSYKADGYDPVTQQFYFQDEFTVYHYPVIDLFFNFRIKTLSAFLKVSHLNEDLPLPGYFTTPFYPGQRRALDIGLIWSFFD